MHDAPGRVRRAVLGGIGDRYFRPSKERAEIIAKALAARDPSKTTDPVAREFRTFCEKAGDDIQAWPHACAGRSRTFTAENCIRCRKKVLVVWREQDDWAGLARGPGARLCRRTGAWSCRRKIIIRLVATAFYKDAVAAVSLRGKSMGRITDWMDPLLIEQALSEDRTHGARFRAGASCQSDLLPACAGDDFRYERFEAGDHGGHGRMGSWAPTLPEEWAAAGLNPCLVWLDRPRS
jgi:hypothetical protein